MTTSDIDRYKRPGLYQQADGELELVLPRHEYDELTGASSYEANPSRREARRRLARSAARPRPVVPTIAPPSAYSHPGLILPLRVLGVVRSSRWDPDADKIILRTESSVIDFARALIGDADQETLLTLATDDDFALLGAHVVAIGQIRAVAVSVDDVIKVPLLLGATGFWTVHNHPSGVATPSIEDTETNDRVARCAKLLGLKLHGGLVTTYRRS